MYAMITKSTAAVALACKAIMPKNTKSVTGRIGCSSGITQSNVARAIIDRKHCYYTTSSPQHLWWSRTRTPLQRYYDRRPSQRQDATEIRQPKRRYHYHGHHRKTSFPYSVFITDTFCSRRGKDRIHSIDDGVDQYLGNLLHGFCNGSCSVHKINNDNSNNNTIIAINTTASS